MRHHWQSMTRILVAQVLALAGLLPMVGEAQIARLELHAVQTFTLSDQEMLSSPNSGKTVFVSGELRIPSGAAGRLPAVVLLHGSGGASAREDGWARALNAVGMATFILDSFTGRGLVSTSNDQAQLGRLATINDAYGAIEVLAKHPRIDGQRIALMGFSRGGQAALYAAMNRLWVAHAPAGGARFAAYVALYPDCSTNYVDDISVQARPIRVFHGAVDDYNPALPCRAYIERLRRAGKDASITEYAEAHHVFDNPDINETVKLPQAQTTRRCRIEETEGGMIINSATKQAFTYADPCVERGTTIAYHPAAHAESVRAITGFLTTVFQTK